MKKTYLFFLLAVLFTFSACGDDEAENENKMEVTATMKYNSGDEYLPDNGASLYIFKNFTDYINYEYIGNGVYQHITNGSKVNYTQKAIANNDGVASMMVDYGQYSLVVWESAHIVGKYGQNIYEIEEGLSSIDIWEIYFEQ